VLSSKKIIAGGSALVIVLVVYLAYSMPSEPRISVAFLGWMDNDPGTTYARFVITNSSHRPILLHNFITEMPTGTSGYAYVTAPIGELRIRPGQMKVVNVLAPLGDSRWKLHVSVIVTGARHAAASWLGCTFFGTRIYRLVPDAIIREPEYVIQSDFLPPLFSYPSR
jgi:hypothetical protein